MLRKDAKKNFRAQKSRPKIISCSEKKQIFFMLRKEAFFGSEKKSKKFYARKSGKK